MKPILETKRLVLREVTPADVDDMLRLHSNSLVQQYTGESTVRSKEDMLRAISERVNLYEKVGYGRWPTFLKDGMQFIGWAGLAYLPEFDEIDLGYRFLPEYWGMGYATEASEAILKYGFGKLDLERIIAIAMKENKASIRVMEKVGMAFDKFARYDPGGEDVAWYQCDKSWLSARAKSGEERI
ncbi:GNAT family N-acetyltransferase [Cryomorphaceae bacterium 1068]|nr:GNAT family N-acetyltransferase [Cryomorphaceae bacterium 1068]